MPPLQSDREIAQALNHAAKAAVRRGVRRDVAVREKRDPKGRYTRARKGEMKGLTGVDAPYEPPENPDLVLDTAGANIDDLVAQVIAVLNNAAHAINR